MTIRCANAAGQGSCTGKNGINIDGARIHVPAGARPYANSDGHLTIIETATGAEYDFWEASMSGSTISAGTAAVVNVNTGSGRGSQGDAAAFGLTAGLLRPSELASGEIDHPLIITVPCVDGTGSRGFTWPAEGGWGSPCGPNGSAADVNAPELGQLLQLNMSDSQIRASSAPSWQKTIMTALAHYGAYVEDVDGNQATGLDIISQASSSWTDLGKPDAWAPLGALKSSTPIPVGDFQVVSPCVPQGRCAGVAAQPGNGSAPHRRARSKHGHRHHHKHRHHRHHHRHRHHPKHRHHHKHRRHH
jgi:hypothetical protein